jgi:transposase
MAAGALRPRTRRAGVRAGGDCTWAGSDTGAADDTGNHRDRVCERGTDAAHRAGRRFGGQRETLKRNPHNGHLFVFRGRRGGLLKVLWHDGQGMCLFAKRLERGRFIWPSTVPRQDADRTVTITPAQLGYLLEGIDWRLPQHTWRPQAAG